MKVKVITVGCPKNTVDSEQALYMMKTAGFTATEDPEQADIILVNTCGFIESAREESISIILEAAQAAGNGARLWVTGCMVARYKDELAEALPEVDAFIGLKDWDELGRLLGNEGIRLRLKASARQARLRSSSYGAASPPLSTSYGAAGRALLTPPWSAYLRIADGCDNRCSYCAIPIIRGGYVSRPFEELLDEAAQLAAGGVRELILIAQDSTRYGVDIYGKRRLVQLITALADIRDLEWIRLMYAHPASLDDELIEVVAGAPKVCRYLEIPLQHSHPDILASMRRPADPRDVLGKLQKLRALNPGVTLRSTFIVGYPGERKEHYLHLRNFLREAALDRAGFFIYSPEEGTPAFDMRPRVRMSTALRRQERLAELQTDVSAGMSARWIGSTIDVLIESREGNNLIGRCHRDAPEIDGAVYLTGQGEVGSIIRATVTHADLHDLYGIIL
ncbi:MAG: 30S ribosomal protein S12 methylthiotransferase RimO [bacterium]|nr:30S ribosomal protein S12 methylthiotransferase RimO [bacterium]